MNDYEKLEYIHSILDQLGPNATPPRDMIEKAQQFVEELREKNRGTQKKRRLTK